MTLNRSYLRVWSSASANSVWVWCFLLYLDRERFRCLARASSTLGECLFARLWSFSVYLWPYFRCSRAQESTAERIINRHAGTIDDHFLQPLVYQYGDGAISARPRNWLLRCTCSRFNTRPIQRGRFTFGDVLYCDGCVHYTFGCAVIGGFINFHFGWSMVFISLLGYVSLAWVVLAFKFKETVAQVSAIPSPKKMISQYKELLNLSLFHELCEHWLA